MAKGSVESNTT